MANEMVHGTQGTSLTQAEFEAVGLHVCNSQAIGDLIYASSATQLTRLGIGSTNQVLVVAGGIPSWNATLASLTLTSLVSATVGAAFSISQVSAVDSYVLIYGGTTAAGAGAMIALTGKSLGGTTGAFEVKTPNAAGNVDVLRLAFSGVAAITKATWTNIYQVDMKFGLAGTATGAYTMDGATSGVVTVTVAATAGTWTMTLPTDDGTANQVLSTDGAGVCSWATAAGGSVDYQAFTATGTWTKPTCTAVYVVVVGAGGGGGGGVGGAADTWRMPGSGGGGGAWVPRLFKAADLGATEAVTIGAGGTGGAGGSSGNGSAGDAGGATDFGTKLYAYGGEKGNLLGNGAGGGGGAGSAGSGNTGGGPAGAAANTSASGFNGAGGSNTSANAGGASVYGGAGGGSSTNQVSSAGGSSLFGGGGGGSAGGVTNVNAEAAGSAGGNVGTITAGGGGTAGAVNGGAGGAGAAGDTTKCGQGGGGGGGQDLGTGGVGGAGGQPGGGGGGGGGGTTVGGAGGIGGAGAVYVWSW